MLENSQDRKFERSGPTDAQIEADRRKPVGPPAPDIRDPAQAVTARRSLDTVDNCLAIRARVTRELMHHRDVRDAADPPP
jgi:hypothetical protein